MMRAARTSLATLSLLLLTASAAAAVEDPNRRHPAAPDVVLQENAAALGVDGWTVHAAIAIAASAAPELEQLRSQARASREAWLQGVGSEQAFQEKRRALLARREEVKSEIAGLLSPAQARALEALVAEERGR
jgi:hypothetical protein